MARGTNNTLVKRQKLPIQTYQTYEELDRLEEFHSQALGTTLQTQAITRIDSQVERGVSHKIDAAERDIWLFFETESSQGWHPDSKHGTAAVRNLADCLVELAQARYANMNVTYFQSETATKFYTTTIREEVEICRSLCTETLASINSDMQQLSSKSGKLWGREGPIMRALRSRTWPADNITAAGEYLKDVEVTHSEILSTMMAIAQRWNRFYTQVHDLMSALSQQLALSPQGRTSVQGRRDKAKAGLAEYTRRRDSIKNRVNHAQNEIESVNRNGATTRTQITELSRELEKLDNTLETLELEISHAEDELNEKPVVFERVKVQEQNRQERVRHKTAQAGWGGWAYSSIFGDTTGEMARLKDWKAIEEEYEEWHASILRKRVELSNKIACTKRERASLALKERQQWSGNKIQQKMEELESQRRNAQADLVGTRPELHELNQEIARLAAISGRDTELLEALVDYAKIVPGLCSSLRALVVNIDLARKAYEQVLNRYQGQSSQLRHMFQRMTVLTASPEEVHILCDDVIRLRIVHLVMASASAWSSGMSEGLYEEALRHLAPLGPTQDGSNIIPGRTIRLDDARKAHEDIYILNQHAEQKGRSMNNARHQAIESLRQHVQDIILSVKTVRPPKPSKWSFSRKSKKSISEWPTPGSVGELP